MRILDLDSGVEMWKMTPSKSETVWSIETGGALAEELVSANQAQPSGLPGESLRKHRLDQDILVVEEKHLGQSLLVDV